MAGRTSVYDLEERTAPFGEAVIRFAKTVKLTPITQPLVTQLVRSATSVGANYCEADDARSKKEFRLRISYCQREARESKHWLWHWSLARKFMSSTNRRKGFEQWLSR